MNKLLKTMVFDNDLSLSVLDTTDMVNTAIKIHGLTPTTAATLGRTLTVGTFMAGDLKNDRDTLSITIAGDGVGGKITVCGNGKYQMRGSMMNPKADLPLKPNGKLDVGGCVGQGRITVVKNMGLKEPYSGTCRIITGEIAQDFTAYYAYSEQRPTAIALGVKIGKDLTCVGAGGVILQAFPGAKEENLIKAEKVISELSNVSTLIEEMGAEGIIKKYFGDLEVYEYFPEYKCTCSREKTERILFSLGKDEVRSIIKEQGRVKVDCEFCRTEYIFTEEDEKRLFNDN